MERGREEIEKIIVSFLNAHSTKRGDGTLPGCGLQHGSACALATCKDNVPRVTPVDFFNEGLTLWILGDPGGKLANIRANDRVAVAMYTPMDHSEENKSLQLWGKAQLITRRHQRELFMKTIAHFGIVEAIGRAIQRSMIGAAGDEDVEAALDKQLDKVTLIKIEAEKIVHLIIPPEAQAEKLIWRKEENTE